MYIAGNMTNLEVLMSAEDKGKNRGTVSDSGDFFVPPPKAEEDAAIRRHSGHVPHSHER